VASAHRIRCCRGGSPNGGRKGWLNEEAFAGSHDVIPDKRFWLAFTPQKNLLEGPVRFANIDYDVLAGEAQDKPQFIHSKSLVNFRAYDLILHNFDRLLDKSRLLGEGGLWIEMQHGPQRDPYQLVSSARRRRSVEFLQ
jgi:hypothetical protein